MLAKKRYGQNFLHDHNVIENIVCAINPHPGELLVEIGPGHGALTKPLLQRAGKLHAIEIDAELIPSLQAHCQDVGELSVHRLDVLKFDFASLVRAGRQMRLLGNLPYNISTPLLFYLLRFRELIRDMHFMLQKEVVLRIIASPGSSDYGRLSVMLQYYCDVAMLFSVSRHCFTPRPQVESAVIKLVPAAQTRPDVGDTLVFEKTVKAAFAQRRKTLRNNLKAVLSAADIKQCDIDPGERAEQLSINEFARLSRMIVFKSTEASI